MRAAAFLGVALCLSLSAQAQLFRAYVASTGSDANPCTLGAPCRLLPAALAAVTNGGEIWMLDSANYNGAPVNVTKSVTILAVPGVVGSVVATAGNAIDIGTAGVKVVLRNLVIVPLPGTGGSRGVSMTAGNSLTVEGCLLANLPGGGIVVTGASVYISNSTVRDNGVNGLWLQSGARGTVTGSTFSGNTNSGIIVYGLSAGTTTTLDIADSTIDGNNGGVLAESVNATAVVKVSLQGSRSVGNVNSGASAISQAGAAVTLTASGNVLTHGAVGISSFSPGARVWAQGNTVSGNVVGLQAQGGGVIESAGDNAVRNNDLDSFGAITPIAGK
jgi:parallel beta-helix repeat protein